MKPETKNFDTKSKETLLDPQIQKNLSGLYGGFHSARIKASSDTIDWEELQTKGREIKKHVINHLDQYLELLESNVISSGGNVYFAETAEDATQYVINLAKEKGVKTVVKSKSMLSEEMSLNEELIKHGIDPYEIDLDKMDPAEIDLDEVDIGQECVQHRCTESSHWQKTGDKSPPQTRCELLMEGAN